MPIFEFLCRQCNRIYSFLSLQATPRRQPVCPRCGASDLSRVPSSFAVAAPRKAAPSHPPADKGRSGGAEREVLSALESLSEAEAADPRTMARLMRRMAEAAGEPVTPTMEEMLSRLEAGEDPEVLEEELGDQLEAEMEGVGEETGAAPERDEGLYDL